MDDSNQNLFNILRIAGPIIFFIVVFAVLYKVADFSLEKSVAIAGIIAVLDYVVLTYVMNKVAK